MLKKIISIIQDLKNRTVLFYTKLNGLLDRSSKGALVGSSLAVFVCIFYLTEKIRTGLPFWVDILIIVGVSISLTVFCFLFSYFLYRVIFNLNKFIVTALIGAVIAIVILPDEKINSFFILFTLTTGVLVGIGASRSVRLSIRIILLSLAVIINLAFYYSLFSKSSKLAVPISDEYWKQNISLQKDLPNPLAGNVYEVQFLTYGSGSDKHREEYNKGVAIKTQSVDGSPFFAYSSRLKHYLRKAYWGFDVKNLPLNARVWYPKAKGNFPLVILVHGNHLMTEYSDSGYNYLGELLASQGFIVASIDENFLNESWYDDSWFREMNVRAWLILKHLEYWRKWSTTKGNPFEGQVDMSRICLIGHSRGADAVALAYGFNQLHRYPFDGNINFDFNFPIKSIVQIAPTGRQSTEAAFPLYIKNVNYLLLHGSHDQDVYYYAGIRMYNRVKIEDTCNYKKSFVYIFKANHGQFNKNWGRMDRDFPSQFFINSDVFLSGQEQRNIAKAYISAFLRSTLKGQDEYLPLLKDSRTGFGFLPRDYYISQYADHSFKNIADFEEDPDLNTATFHGCTITAKGFSKWEERIIPLRSNENEGQENTGVFLSWEEQQKKDSFPCYTLDLSNTSVQNYVPDSLSNLCLLIANNSSRSNQVNFSIQIITKSSEVKKSFNDFYRLPPLLKTELVKWNLFKDLKKNMPVERVLQFVQIPLSAFSTPGHPIAPKDIRQINFIFDKQPFGSVILDKIGFN